MKIIIVHNMYKEHGGEDTMVLAQKQLLDNESIINTEYITNNSDLSSLNFFDKVKRYLPVHFNNSNIKDLLKLIDSFKPDLIHIHNVFFMQSPNVYKALSKVNVPVVQTMHNYRALCTNGLLYNRDAICTKCLRNRYNYHSMGEGCYRNSRLASFMFSNLILKFNEAIRRGYITHIIAPTSFTVELMEKSGYQLNNISVIPNFMQTSLFADENVVEKEYFLYLGRLSSEKGLLTLIETFKLLGDKYKLKIAGTGPLEILIQNRIKDMNNIDYVGFVKGEEKSQLIRNSKAVIIPSEWYEVFGLVVIEAYSNKVPVIASNLGGLATLVKEGETGYLFEGKNKYDLAKKIRKIEKLSDSEYCEMCNGSKQYFDKNFTLEVVGGKYRELYIDIIKEYINEKK